MPTEPTPEPARDHHAPRDRRPSEDVDQVPLAPSTGPSVAPSTAASPAGRESAGWHRKSGPREAFDNPPRSTEVWKPTGVRRQEVLRALGIFQRATAEHLWRMLRPGDRHDRCTRDTLNALKKTGMVRVERRLKSGHQLWVLTETGHREARGLLPRNVRVSALCKQKYDTKGRPVPGQGYDEHAAAVTLTAAVLTGAGYGTPLSWQTEIAHKLPYGYTQYADLTMRAPDTGVPAMLLEVDRVTEPVDELVDKLCRYSDWFELLAPRADPNKEMAARYEQLGGKVQQFRLWPRLYPASGREGYVPVAFVFTGKTAAQRESRMRRLEQAGRRYFAGEPYPGRGAGITAVDYNQAVPVLVTELERITTDPAGAAGEVWRRLGREEWQTLGEALDNPDGDRLYLVQWRAAKRRREEREAAEREARRPVCTQCGAKFTDEHWQYLLGRGRSWGDRTDELCGPCRDEHFARLEAERAARREAEEDAAREAAQAEEKARKRRGPFRRRT
ncbi:replication-relaxation family protein [Streptomyces sp. NPDC012825]|uniref:replication-relaxation family protein n=1 Tax=Streptomyces sp. NPDC012825 TaxID=3364851 RepID=UPI0036C2416E